MKKILTMATAATLLLSGCGTSVDSGAYTGSMFGTILGSAIGGIAGGPRGSDIGTIVGMAGGAAIGGAVSAQRIKSRQEETAENWNRKSREIVDEHFDTDTLSSGFDPSNSGDDRLYDFGSSDYTGNYSASKAVTTTPAQSSVEELTSTYTYTPEIEIRNARFVDSDRDSTISRGEVCKVIFEVYNRGRETLHDVVPTVIDAGQSGQVMISPSIHVEQIEPGHGIRYTAIVMGGRKLKAGTIKICASVLQGDKTISKVTEFVVKSKK